MISSEVVVKALNWRFATKVFDSGKKIAEQDLKAILESGRLAPSSFGIEAWKFLVIENLELRSTLRASAWGQAQVTDASHLIVIARRTDVRENIAHELMARTAQTQGVAVEALAGYKQMLDGNMASKSDADLDAWVRAQTYIALGMMIETAAMLEIDSCPMEGFDPQKFNEILGLAEKNLSATTILAVGYRGGDEAVNRSKTRRGFEDVVEFISA